MGSGRWDTHVYDAAERIREASGKSAFDYSDSTRSRSRTLWAVHPTLDPKLLNTLGQKIRESRDSAEHPDSRAVAVFFDMTGSMGGIPEVFQRRLKELEGLFLQKGYLAHPQILYGAIGDAKWDRVPLQVGQFESDNRADENLSNLFIESGGGPYINESYEMVPYFMARHSACDCWEKRGIKGYLFTMGDEMPYEQVEPNLVEQFIGDSLQAPIPTSEIIAEVSKKYNYFHMVVTDGSNGQDPQVEKAWRALLGQRVLRLDDPEAICETIALAIGLMEGKIDLETGKDDLASMGVDSKFIRAATTAVSRLPVVGITVKGDGFASLTATKPVSSRTKRL